MNGSRGIRTIFFFLGGGGGGVLSTFLLDNSSFSASPLLIIIAQSLTLEISPTFNQQQISDMFISCFYSIFWVWFGKQLRRSGPWTGLSGRPWNGFLVGVRTLGVSVFGLLTSRTPITDRVSVFWLTVQHSTANLKKEQRKNKTLANVQQHC